METDLDGEGDSLDEAILKRRAREIGEAWSAITDKELRDDTKEKLDDILKIMLSETQDVPSHSWWFKYLDYCEDIGTYGLPEAAAIWILVKTVAVYAGTTGFKRALAAIGEAEELLNKPKSI